MNAHSSFSLRRNLVIAVAALFFLGTFSLPAMAQNEDTSSKSLTSSEKLFGLSKFWSEVKYNFVYFNRVGAQKWDSIYRVFMEIVPQTKTDSEYYKEMQRMCAMLKDGHTNVYFRRNETVTTYFDSLQWMLGYIEGKAIVVRINERNKTKIPVGTEIVKVNGLPTRQYIEKYSLPYISSSTDYVRWEVATQAMLQSPIGTAYDVELLTPDKRTLKMRITHAIEEPVRSDPMYPQQERRKLLELKWYPGDVAYVALNSFDNREIVKMFSDVFPELRERAKKLIIDLRNNGGGNTNNGADILRYLTPDSELLGSRWETRVHAASYAAWGGQYTSADTVGSKWAKKAYLSSIGEYYEGDAGNRYTTNPNQPRLVVPTVLLIGSQTASAAEDFLILADKQKHMIKMGQPSFGSTGQPIFVQLTRDFSARICTKKDTYPDGRLFVGYGVKPDVEFIPTVKDFIDGRDGGLETALDYLKKQK